MALAILSKEEQLLWNYQSSCRCGLFSFILLGEAVAGQRKLHYTLRSQFPKAIPSSAGGCAAHLKTPSSPLTCWRWTFSKVRGNWQRALSPVTPATPGTALNMSPSEMSRTAQAGLSAQRPMPTWNAHTSLNGFELQKSNHLVRKRDTVPRSYFEKLSVLVDLSWRWRASWQYALKTMWKDSKNLMQETRVGKLINERWDGFYWQHYQKLQSKDWDFSKKADNWSQQTPAQFEWSCQNPWTAP